MEPPLGFRYVTVFEKLVEILCCALKDEVILWVAVTGLKNGWTCAVKLRSSSRHSIFKMADDESKSNTSL